LSEVVFRLFVSSPRDVAAERVRTEAVVEKLNVEFKDRARLRPVFWEEHYYSAHESFQKQIPEAADCDLVVAIFRARLGSPLPPDFKRQPDGEPYPSGTAYEVLSAIAKRHSGSRLPDIYVFRYRGDLQVSLGDPKKGEIEAQWAALRGFFDRWDKSPSGQFIASFQTYDSPDDFARQVEDCLRQWLEKHGFAAREIWDRGRFGSPFPGLTAFDASREHIFFGRDLAIRQAIEQLRSAKTPFLLILGASGSGKSSLLRAGLIPKLTRPGAIPEVDLFRPVVMTPGIDPFAELAEALLAPQALGAELAGGRFADKTALTRALKSDPGTAVGLIGEWLDKAAEARCQAARYDNPRPARLLIAIDQGERLFSDARTHADAFGRLLQALAGAAADVIIVLRSDAYPRFQDVAPLCELRAAGATLDLLPPTPAELEDIVKRPVDACQPPLAFGFSEPPLPERLVVDAKGGDALPLVQVTLERLYQAQESRADGILSAQDYKGMPVAVTKAADAAMAQLGERARKALESLVAALVTDVAPDPITAKQIPVVRALDRDAFIEGKPDRAALVDAFVRARLLTIESGMRVRPTHDALLRIWPEAAALVEEMGPLLRARHVLTPLAQDWANAATGDKPKHLKISAPLLAAGQQLEARFGDDLGEPLQQFIAEAGKAARKETERQTRRARFIIVVSAIVAAGMAGLAGAAVWEWYEAASQRNAAENNFSAATDFANALASKVAKNDSNVFGVRASVIIKDALTPVSEMLTQLGLVQARPELLRALAAALDETSAALLSVQDPEGALQAATNAREICSRLPNKQENQSELANADEKVGDAEVDLDDGQALASYQKEREIFDRLASSDPGDAKSARGLSNAYNKLGDLMGMQGQTGQAVGWYRQGFDIISGFANRGPENDDWKHDLFVSDLKLAGVQGLPDDKLALYEKARAIIEPLAASDSNNKEWQLDLSLVFERTGDVKKMQGSLAEALDLFRRSLAIRRKLRDDDPHDARWAWQLSIAYDRIGDVQVAQGDLDGALTSYRDSLAIRDELAKADPDDPGRQRDLSVYYRKVGDVRLAQGDLDGALKSFRDSLDIANRLAKSDAGNADRQRDLAVSYASIASVYRKKEDDPKAREALEKGQTIMTKLVARSPDNPDWKEDLRGFDQKLAALKP
jgi:tetratricopeptide (TPR) repeat protein